MIRISFLLKSVKVMPLTDKEKDKIGFDAIVSRRLKEVQNIANKELEIAFWLNQKLKHQHERADGVIATLNKEIAFCVGMVESANKLIDEYEKNKDKKGS